MRRGRVDVRSPPGPARTAGSSVLSISCAIVLGRLVQQDGEVLLDLVPLGGRELLPVDDERRSPARSRPARCRCGRDACRGWPAPDDAVAVALRGDGSFSPPVTCRNHSRVSSPAKSASDQHPDDGESAAAVRLGHAVAQSRRRDSAVRHQVADHVDRAQVAEPAGAHRIRQFAGVLAARRPPDQREHDRGDHRVVERGDDHDPEAVEATNIPAGPRSAPRR